MVIVAKYFSYCAACGKTIAAGTKVRYEPSGKKGKRVRCLSCPETPKAAAPATPAPSPESLEREVEKWTKDMVAEYLDCMDVDEYFLTMAFEALNSSIVQSLLDQGVIRGGRPYSEALCLMSPGLAKKVIDLAAKLKYTTPG
jgi:hypothetical protein